MTTTGTGSTDGSTMVIKSIDPPRHPPPPPLPRPPTTDTTGMQRTLMDACLERTIRNDDDDDDDDEQEWMSRVWWNRPNVFLAPRTTTGTAAVATTTTRTTPTNDNGNYKTPTNIKRVESAWNNLVTPNTGNNLNRSAAAAVAAAADTVKVLESSENINKKNTVPSTSSSSVMPSGASVASSSRTTQHPAIHSSTIPTLTKALGTLYASSSSPGRKRDHHCVTTTIPLATVAPKKKKLQKTEQPHCLIWVSVVGRNYAPSARTWRQKDLKIVGVYANKNAAQQAKDALMARHRCCGHGDIQVGPYCDDDIDLVIRECPLFL